MGDSLWAGYKRETTPQIGANLEKAISLQPNFAPAHAFLCIAYTQSPVTRSRALAQAQRNLARVLLPERRYEEIAVLLNQSLSIEPTNPWALTNAAYAELQLHKFQEAADHALRVERLPHEGLANVHVIAGYALEALRQQPEAAEQWKLYLKEDPKGPNAERAREAVARLASEAPK